VEKPRGQISRNGNWFEFSLVKDGVVQTWKFPGFDLAAEARRRRRLAGWQDLPENGEK
jgi:hypothetical protein